MEISDWINLIAAILVGGGTLFLGIMAWRTIRQTRNIQEAEKRERLLNQKSFLIWFTGMSGSGKITIGTLLEKELHKKGYLTFILDGDNIREGLNSDLDFSEKGREENIRRVGHVAKLMVDAGIITIATFISPFNKDRKKVRDLFEKDRFIEIFINCPLDICIERDPKGLYKKALNNEIKSVESLTTLVRIMISAFYIVKQYFLYLIFLYKNFYLTLS